MKETTKQRKKSIDYYKAAQGRDWVVEKMYQIFATGKRAFDAVMVGYCQKFHEKRDGFYGK